MLQFFEYTTYISKELSQGIFLNQEILLLLAYFQD